MIFAILKTERDRLARVILQARESEYNGLYTKNIKQYMSLLQETWDVIVTHEMQSSEVLNNLREQ